MLHYAVHPKSSNTLVQIQEKYTYLIDAGLSPESQAVRYHFLEYLAHEYEFHGILEKDEYGKPIPIVVPFQQPLSVLFETSQKESRNKDGILLYWSLSHSEHHLAYIVSDAPTGIDIAEYCERDASLLDSHSNQDYGILGGKNWNNFYLLWTAKECIIKLVGGQLDDMGLIQLVSRASEDISIFAFRQETYRIHTFKIGSLFLSYIL